MTLSYIKSHAQLADFDPEVCVIKLGSTVVTTDIGHLDSAVLDQVARFVSARMKRGKVTFIVSSGAVAAGIGEIGFSHKPRSLPERQALAAVGQGRLMAAWGDAFRKYDRHVAQLLLTAKDLEDRRRYLNIRYTLDQLVDMGVAPIINENDTVTVDELRFGDNDDLALLMTMKMMGDCLILLTSVGGLYRTLPSGDESGDLIEVVDKVNSEIESLVSSDKSAMGSGGMGSKLRVARTASEAGIPTIIAPGKRPDVFDSLFKGQGGGTLFVPGHMANYSRRQRFIAFSRTEAKGRITIDAGAERALVTDKKSLLPIGVKRTEGEYDRQDVVEVIAPDGRPIARGLTHYSSREVFAIMGHKTNEIEGILGSRDYDEIIHRDNLVILEKAGAGPEW
ncbi:MAG: glutamate 5-kinase [Candidatus Sumerlaeia bacterium]